MPGFRPFLCLVAPFVAAALLPVGADAAPSLAQAIKRGDAKYLKLKDLDAKPVTPNIEAEVKDVSADPRFRPAHEAYLKGMITEVPDEEVNGFLAGYVGEKILLGEGEQAWALMLDYYDKASDCGLDVCDKPLDADGNCPGKTERLTFPAALERMLNENGYRLEK